MGRIVGYHGHFEDGVGYLVNDTGVVRRESPFLDWLLEDNEGPEKKNVAYDLDQFVATVLRLIDFTKEEGQELLDNGKMRAADYNITYFPSKYFGIFKRFGGQRWSASFYDAGQYLDAPSLELGMPVGRAIEKAKEARDIAALVSRIYFDLGWDGNTLTSPIRSLEVAVLRDQKFPTHNDIPPTVNDIALRSCRGSWVEAFRVGQFPKAFDLDLRSAYPWCLSELVDLRRGAWTAAQERPEGALYGFQEGAVTMEAPFHPILYGTGEREDTDYSYTPTGSWDTVLAADEVDFIREYGLGQFEPELGWWYIPQGGQYQPIKGVINWLYEKRQDKEGLELKVLKRGMAALWGRQLEVRGDEYGPMFNPVFGALVEARTRIAVARFVLDNKIKPIHIAVDGVLTDAPVAVPEHGGMGTWKLAHTGGALVLSSGVAAVEGKEGAEDFSIKYAWLKARMEQEPDATEYVMQKVSPMTLAKSLNTDYSKLGQLEEVTKTISVGGDAKRLYWDVPVTGGDVLANHYESEPVDISVAVGRGA